MHNRLGDLWLGDWWHHPSDPSLFSPKVHHPISKAFLKPRSEIPSFAASKPKLELEGAQILSSQRRSQLYGGFLCTWFNPKLGSTSLGTGRSPTLFSSAHPQTHPNGVVTQIARYHQILGIWWVVSKYPSLEPQDTQSQGTYVCGQMMSVDVSWCQIHRPLSAETRWTFPRPRTGRPGRRIRRIRRIHHRIRRFRRLHAIWGIEGIQHLAEGRELLAVAGEIAKGNENESFMPECYSELSRALGEVQQENFLWWNWYVL